MIKKIVRKKGRIFGNDQMNYLKGFDLYVGIVSIV